MAIRKKRRVPESRVARTIIDVRAEDAAERALKASGLTRNTNEANALWDKTYDGVKARLIKNRIATVKAKRLRNKRYNRRDRAAHQAHTNLLHLREAYNNKVLSGLQPTAGETAALKKAYEHEKRMSKALG
jgi:hypothetical protein